VQVELVAFQKTHKLGKQDFEYGTVTKNWWRGFMERHRHKIVTKREKFALNRADWTTLPNIRQMYDVIYDKFVDAKVAVYCELYFTDFYGNPTDEANKYGHAQNNRITHPGWVLMADESGFSTSQKKDGHVGGQQFVVKSGIDPQLIASTNNCKFTLLPFTSVSGGGFVVL
jgi:hypothetical protein